MTARFFVVPAVLLIALACGSASVSAQPPSHGWASVDSISSQAAQDGQSYSATRLISLELAKGTVTYPALASTRTTAFDAGLLVWRGLGAGVRVDSAPRTMTASLTASIPNPLFFNRPYAGTTATTLERDERAIDLMAAYTLPIPRWVGVRVFAGASQVQITQGYVSRFSYTLTGQAVSFASVEQQSETTRTWGTHAGVDVAFYPRKHIGIGVNVLRRQVDVPAQAEPFTSSAFAVRADSTTVGVGARVRF